MKTLLTSYRVGDLGRSLDFYHDVGFREVGRVRLGDGAILVMLNLPGDGDVVTLELAHDPAVGPVEIGNGFSHLAVQVDDLAATLADLDAKGVAHPGIERPAGDAGPASGMVNTAFMLGGGLGLAILASLAAARTEGLAASGTGQLAALSGGYDAAFLVGAIFAAGAAALGAGLLRVTTPGSPGAGDEQPTPVGRA